MFLLWRIYRVSVRYNGGVLFWRWGLVYRASLRMASIPRPYETTERMDV